MCGNALVIRAIEWVLIVVYYYTMSISPQAGKVGEGPPNSNYYLIKSHLECW